VSHILDKQIVLSLNGIWQPLEPMSVRAAITAMTGGSDAVDARGKHLPPALALDLEVVDGETVNARPVDWDEWITLPVRDGDLAIHASHNRSIRVPTVVIRPNYKGMPMKSRKFSFEAVWDRDHGVDQYTGQKLQRDEANLDHVVPASRGGLRTFENMVTCHKRTNTKKANKLPEEVGLKLIRVPTKPKPVPASVVVSHQVPGHPSWIPFLHK